MNDEPEFESCVRCDTAVLEFSGEFTMWMVVANFDHNYSCSFLCMGWEL